MPAESEEPELVRWRPWPCENCRGGATLLDYLLGRHEAGGEIPGDSEDEIIDAMIAPERAWVVDWVESCEHTAERSDSLAKLDEGSEHIVYLAPGGKEVIKLTKPGVYGDSYYLVDGRVHQRCSTPCDYMIRLAMLKLTFGFAPNPVGITKAGQVVTLQRFVVGEPPASVEVDEFLLLAGFEPVKRSCWLWKKKVPNNDAEYWIGDAREDNFVKTPRGIVRSIFACGESPPKRLLVHRNRSTHRRAARAGDVGGDRGGCGRGVVSLAHRLWKTPRQVRVGGARKPGCWRAWWRSRSRGWKRRSAS